jgi:hypothetical protein
MKSQVKFVALSLVALGAGIAACGGAYDEQTDDNGASNAVEAPHALRYVGRGVIIPFTASGPDAGAAPTTALQYSSMGRGVIIPF